MSPIDSSQVPSSASASSAKRRGRAKNGWKVQLTANYESGVPAGDAILDRIVHTAHRINLTGHSLRRSRASRAPRIDRRTTECQKIIRQRGTGPPGGIMSESRATSSRNARATSSESALV